MGSHQAHRDQEISCVVNFRLAAAGPVQFHIQSSASIEFPTPLGSEPPITLLASVSAGHFSCLLGPVDLHTAPAELMEGASSDASQLCSQACRNHQDKSLRATALICILSHLAPVPAQPFLREMDQGNDADLFLLAEPLDSSRGPG
jgi:hypothetical protein